MTVLSTGRANGGLSILHAAGLSQGCSIGIALETVVEIVSEPLEVEEDSHSLLDSVEEVWRDALLPLPPRFGWSVASTVPIGMGLKSSSALACAALRALNEVTWAGLSDSEIVELAVAAQRLCECTITGSMDDCWAAIRPGWNLIDPFQPAAESVLLSGEIEDGLMVLIILRGKRENFDFKIFSEQSILFNRALSSLANGSIFASMTANGMAVAASLGDEEALRICNSAITAGALSASISGSGPAIAIVVYNEDIEDIKNILSRWDFEIIITNFSCPEIEEVL